MNPAYLPPSQNNFNPPSNGFQARPNVPYAPTTKNGPPPVSSPSPGFLPPPGPPSGPPMEGYKAAPSPGYTQQNGQQQFGPGNGPPQQPYLGNSELSFGGPPAQARPGPGQLPPGPQQPLQYVNNGAQMASQQPSKNIEYFD